MYKFVKEKRNDQLRRESRGATQVLALIRNPWGLSVIPPTVEIVDGGRVIDDKNNKG